MNLGAVMIAGLPVPLSCIDEKALFIDRERQHLLPGVLPPHLGDIDIMLELIAFLHDGEFDNTIGHRPDEILLTFGKYSAVNEQEECLSLATGRYETEEEDGEIGK
jgi:hypothetical protein